MATGPMVGVGVQWSLKATTVLSFPMHTGYLHPHTVHTLQTAHVMYICIMNIRTYYTTDAHTANAYSQYREALLSERGREREGGGISGFISNASPLLSR